MREAASFIATRSSHAPAGLIAELLHDVGAAIHSWNSRRKLARLSELDDRLLADVGVTRDDVDWALQLPFSVDPSLELQRRSLRHHLHGWRD
jgi:uncharacterized protein YjiS (DUF1127 family)